MATRLASEKIGILRAKTGVYLTNFWHLAICLTTEKLALFVLFFMLDNVLGNVKMERKKLFTLKKIKKYAEKHEKSENVRKV